MFWNSLAIIGWLVVGVWVALAEPLPNYWLLLLGIALIDILSYLGAKLGSRRL